MRSPSLLQSKILIIDDEEYVVAILRHILEVDGYQAIASTTDPTDAVRLFLEFQPDLVVLDWRMPVLTGRDVLSALRAVIPPEAYVPVVVVTADPTLVTRREALNSGASDFVAKPYDTIEILARIGNLLETQSRGRKRVEDARRESEERFAGAFEHAPIGVALVAPDGRFLKVNRALCAITGYAEAELLARTFQDITHPEDMAGDLEYVRQALEGEIRAYTMEKRYIHRLGHLVTVQISCSLAGDTTDGRYFVSHIQDISERKKAEEELFQSRETLRGIFDHIPQRVFWKSRDLIYLGCNQAFAEDAGFSDPSEVIGRSDFDTKWKNLADVYRADDLGVMQADASKESFEELGIGPDGEERWLRTSKTPLHDREGRVIGVLGTYEDVTAHKRAKLEIELLNAELEKRVEQRTEDLFVLAQEAELGNQAKTDFLSRTSHELRTPMNAILGFAQLLEMEENLAPEARECVAQILDAGRHLVGLIDEVLDISQTSSDGYDLPVEAVPVLPLIENALGRLRPLAVRLDIELELKPPASGVWSVLANAQRLEQVLRNLLDNGIQYNHQGGRVTLECFPMETLDPPMFQFRVIDTGPGISPENVRRLFRPFDRLDVERSRTEVLGSGLGLAVSKRLVELMEGSIGVDSVPGVGSIFWIQVPLIQTPDATSCPPVRIT